MTARRRRIATVAGLAVAIGVTAEAQVRLGPEIQVNATITGRHRRPELAMDAAGNFVIVWSLDWSAPGIFGRRFDASGKPLGLDFQVNSYTTDEQAWPSVSTAADGSFVVAWVQETVYPAPLVDDVFARRFDAAGAPLGDQFLVNAVTTDRQAFPSVAVAPAGTSSLPGWTGPAAHRAPIWRRGGTTRPGCRKAASSGSTRTRRATEPAPPRRTTRADSSSWHGRARGRCTDSRVVVRRFDQNGVPEGPGVQVNTYTTDSQSSPSVAAAPNGDFVVVWQSRDQDGSWNGVFGRRFDAAGAPLADEFPVNVYTTLDQFHADVAMDSQGNFVVAWTSMVQGSLYEVYARL